MRADRTADDSDPFTVTGARCTLGMAQGGEAAVLGFRQIAMSLLVACVLVGAARGIVRTGSAVKPSAPEVLTPAAASGGAIALHADSRGHFVTSVLVNGRTITMMVDTGASLCAFSESEAESLGLKVRPSDFTRLVQTANGLVRVAPVKLRLVQIGPVAVRDVEAVVIPRGRLGTGLLGMSFLSRLRDFSVAGARITLRG